MFNEDIVYIPDSTNEFATSDLGCAAAILSAGCKLEEIQKGLGQKCVFVFRSSEELANAVQKYWRNELFVDALTYFNCIRQIKNEMYSS